MNREKLVFQMLLCLGLAIPAALPAQVPVDENGNPIAAVEDSAYESDFNDEDVPLLTAAELESIVGPVALYPDDLLAIVLPASTYPLQVVQAARFLEQLQDDSSLKPDEEWDESVTALLNYPEVVELMNEDIDWTWRLGEAVVAQQADVISAIESFRDKAYAAGNLKTDEHQTVSNEDGVIEIEPVQEDVLYVPYYEPERVVVYQPYPVYHYYPRAYPLYYYPYPYGYSFHTGFFWGVTTAFTIGWVTDHLHVYHHSYWGHPYYGRHYHHHHYYRRPSLTHFNHYYVHNSRNHWNYRYRDGDYWRPRRHGGARPGHHTRRVNYYEDRNRRHNSSGRWASSRDDDRGEGRHNRHNRSADDRRDRRDEGDRQAPSRDRRNLGDRRSTRNDVIQGSDDIRFRPRSRGGDANRHRARASDNPSRSTRHRTSFASSRRPASEPPEASRRSTFNSSSGSRHDRSQQVAMNNPRRNNAAAAPRQAPRPAHAAPVHRPPARSGRSRSEAARNESPPSAPQQSAPSSRRSENRASSRSSRGSSRRSEGRFKRH